MTRVLYEPKRFHLRIDGHAGSAPKGEDLVCAGVSALAFALLQAMTDFDGSEAVVEEEDGIIDVRCDPAPYEVIACEAVMDAFAGGLSLLASEYPQYVKYEERSD